MNGWEFSVVSEEDAKKAPYPYVKVTEEGGAHELDATDRAYLEEKFHPGDGARPWVKRSFDDKDGRGGIAGFCPRWCLPAGVTVLPPQADA